MFIIILKYVVQKKKGIDDFLKIGLLNIGKSEAKDDKAVKAVFFDGRKFEKITNITEYEIPKETYSDSVLFVRENFANELTDDLLNASQGILVHCFEDKLPERLRGLFSSKKAFLDAIKKKSASFTIGGKNERKLELIKTIQNLKTEGDCVADENLKQLTASVRTLHGALGRGKTVAQAHDWLELYLNIQLLISEADLAEKMRKSVEGELTQLFDSDENGNFTDLKAKELFSDSGLENAAQTFASVLAAYSDKKAAMPEFKEAAEAFLKVIRESQRVARQGESGQQEGVDG